MSEPLKIVNGLVVWSGNQIKLADSVIQREANFDLDRACRVIVSDRVSIRDKVLAYLSIFPLLIAKSGEDDIPMGPTLEVVSMGIDLTNRGQTLRLRSDKPLAICLDRDKEGIVQFVLFNQDKIILKVVGVYLNIEMPPPSPDCGSCDLM